MRSSICIVTDSSAQFSQASFPGQAHVRVVSLPVSIKDKIYYSGDEYRPSNLPLMANQDLRPHLLPPPASAFRDLFLNLSKTYDTIIGIFISDQLLNCLPVAEEAARLIRGKTRIELIDSQSVSTGLGYMVQMAAEAIEANQPATEVEKLVRSLVPQTYITLCTPGLSYLNYNGFIDNAQATIAEMLGLFPIFSVEAGKLVPMEKVRSMRHTINFFQEFLDEFDQLRLVSFLQSALPQNIDTRLVYEGGAENHPKPLFTKHILNLPAAALFGPGTLGLVIVE